MIKKTVTNLILKPLITEKSLNDASIGRYTFKVPTWADKNSLRKALKEAFDVDTKEVRTVTYKGKPKRAVKTKAKIYTQSWKKAIFYLKEGQKIAVFEVKSEKK